MEKTLTRKNPFSVEHLMERDGITREEATFIIRSRKKMCKEYWISRGYSEEDAIIEIKKFQTANGKKAAENKRKNPEKYKAVSTTQLAYYINKRND